MGTPDKLSLHVSGLKVFGDRSRQLLSVDYLSITTGSLVGIYGPSGAGKTTLLHALGGLSDQVKGVVKWGEYDLVGKSSGERGLFRAQNIGLIFQDFLLFDELSAWQNACLQALFHPKSERADITKRAEEDLERLGIKTGGRGIASLSGGERQRVAVARALCTDAPIILADEPTANLSRESADKLIDDLTKLAKQKRKTLIIVSHDTKLLSKMNRLIEIKDGVITADKSLRTTTSVRGAVDG